MYNIAHYLDANGRDIYQAWLNALRDQRARRAITARVTRLGSGLFGNQKYLGEGVHELRIDLGPGYRIYYSIVGSTLILLLCGGSKLSQDMDIRRAIRNLKDWKKHHAQDTSGP